MKKSVLPLVFILLISCICNGQTPDSWSRKADFGGGSRDFAVAFSIGNMGYMGTGENENSNVLFYKDFWEYDPNSNVWSQKANFGGTGRVLAVGFSIGLKGYIGLGADSSSSYDSTYEIVNDFWEYDASKNLWSRKADFPGKGRVGAVGFSIEGNGYIGTGSPLNSAVFLGADTTYYNDFWEYDTLTDSWLQKANFSGKARTLASSFVIADKGYIGMGEGAPNHGVNSFSDFWVYSPDSNIWNRKSACLRSVYGGASFSIGNKGYTYDGGLFEYNATKDLWTSRTIIPVDKNSYGRTDGIGFSIGNKGYVGTGIDNYSSLLDVYDFREYTNCDSFKLVASAKATICQRDTTNLLASGAASYLWTPQTDLSLPDSSHTYAFPYATTTYLVNGTTNMCRDTISLTITVNKNPILSTSGTKTICQGDTANLLVSGAATYSWLPSFGLNAPSSANPVAAPTISTTYTVTGTGSDGCHEKTTVLVAVNTTPNVTATGSTTICSGLSTKISAIGANNYLWSPPQSLNYAYFANPTASPASSTTYTVTGTTNGCSDTALVIIKVKPTPIVTVNGNRPICADDSINLSAAGATSYIWEPNTEISNSAISSPTVFPATSTTYTLIGSNPNGCSDTTTVAISVSPSITLQVILGPSNASPFQTESYSVTNQPGVTYTWSTLNGNITAGQGTNSVAVQWGNNGVGKLSLTISNGACTDSISLMVSVGATGILEPGWMKEIEVRPNPFKENVSIQFPTFVLPIQLILTDMLGRVIETTVVDQPIVQLDLGELPAGIYLVKLQGPESKIIKLVKSN